jgi:hypothetical protein
VLLSRIRGSEPPHLSQEFADPSLRTLYGNARAAIVFHGWGDEKEKSYRASSKMQGRAALNTSGLRGEAC